MLEIFFTCGIALAVYLIFNNVEILAAYSDYVFWVFIGCIILLAIVGVICAVIDNKTLSPNKKAIKKCSDGRKTAAQNPPRITVKN